METVKPDVIEEQVLKQGRQLVAALHAQTAREGDSWLDQLLERLMADDAFRVQALRFVDLMPALDSDADLVAHLHQYFPANEFPLPGIAKWGLKLGQGMVGSRLMAIAIKKSVALMGTRFLGGSTSAEVLKTVTALRGKGLSCSLDLLGEESVSESEADDYLQRYLELLDDLPPRLEAWKADSLLDCIGDRPLPRLNLSVKLSSLYSQMTPRDFEGSVEAVAQRLRPLLRKMREKGAAICLDMEHYDLKGIILAVLQQVLLEEEFRDWPDVAVALQAYLHDAERDLVGLADWARERGTPVTVRLVRGAYWDQETIVSQREGWPIPVWTRKEETDAGFESCLSLLMSYHPHLEAAVATHNVRSIAKTMALAEQYGIPKGRFEFQMLFGMGQGLPEAIAAMGYRVRIYTPFGELLPGMAYLVRRLLENSSSQSWLRMARFKGQSEETLLAPPVIREEVEESEPAGFRSEPVRRFTAEQEREGLAKAIRQLRGRLGEHYPLVIGGRNIETGDEINSYNPARPDELIGKVSAAGEEEAEAAVEAAHAAFPAWSGLSAQERADYLLRAARALRRQRERFSAWEVLEAAKPWGEADADVAEAIDFLEYYARQAVALSRSRRFDLPGETNAAFYRPRGVGVVIPPWNFPLAILTGMLSAAIVTGNTVVLKPSSQTPVVAAHFMELLRQLELPDGVVNLLPGSGAGVGEYLVRHPSVHFIAFTGSREVGIRIARLAAELNAGQQHVKRVIAEMGGKNAIIVDSDADPDDAVRGVTASAFGFSGQKCSACSRVILVGGGNARFLERLVAATRSLKIGPPEEPGSFMGPVIEATARDRIRKAVEEGKGAATLLHQTDCSHLGEGYYVGPAIFTGVAPESPLGQEEIFGPVLAVMEVPDFDRALQVANATRYALTGGVYSRSPRHLEQAVREFQVGNLYLNRRITGARVGHQPFGGFKLSGMGTKAGGPDYLLQFVEPRSVTENTLRKGFAPL